MKKIIFLTFTVLIAVISNAQIMPTSKVELQIYYKDNILKLDPIEGIYDVAVNQWGENAFTRFPGESTELDPVMIYKDKNGSFKWYGNDQVTIKKVSSNVYNFNVFYSGSNVTGTTRFILKEGRFFEAPTSIPDRQLRYDMGRNYQAGFQVHFDYTFSKTYPSEEMYYRAKEEEHRVAIENNTPKQWSGTVTIVGCDKNNDLALLKISDSNFTGFGPIPYAISNTTSEVGEDVFVLGYPLTSTMGDEIKLTTGIISSRTGFQGDVALYQISAPIQPGNSGGPLFDKKGNVIGIVSAKHSGAENVGYAIKTMYLRNLVESCANASIIPTNNTISTLALTGKVKKEKSFVFFINCSK